MGQPGQLRTARQLPRDRQHNAEDLGHLHRPDPDADRKIVLIGHSQGAEMVVRLLQRFFDGDPALRERLLVAMAIGGRVDVPKGKLVAPPAGSESACVNPGSFDRNERRPLSRAYFPTVGRSGKAVDGTGGVTTPFVLFCHLSSAQCLDGPDGYRYLGISTEPGEPGPIDLTDARLDTALGLHILDFQLPQGDLIDLAKRRAAALP